MSKREVLLRLDLETGELETVDTLTEWEAVKVWAAKRYHAGTGVRGLPDAVQDRRRGR